VDDEERALGGYSPDAGRNAHQADAPTLIPVPSLLRSLLSDHLDPGYAAAAARREEGRTRGRASEWGWRLLAGVAVAAVFACAAAQARSVAPATRETQHVLVDGVRSAETAADDVTVRRDALAGEVEAERRGRLEGDELGRQLLANLDAAESVASATPVHGPGLTIVITEPKSVPDLSDVSKQQPEGRRQVILDRDLQLVVNSLWASGAEAVSVGGVRMGPNMTIRQAGGGILVDNRPITSPAGAYVVLAVGPPHGMREAFDGSPGLQRIRLLEAAYAVGVSVAENSELEVPGGSARDLNFAKQIGPP
jgi:uncharacterized protein YlxW (UPF0749 family)